MAATERGSKARASAGPNDRPLADLFRKEPYLIFSGDPTRMTVLWQLTATDTSLVQWGVDSSYATGGVLTTEYGTDHQHWWTLEDLTPGQHYLYRVVVQGVSHPGSFNAAPPPTASRLDFLAYGDTRSYPADHDQVAASMMATWNAAPTFQSFALVVGDLVDNGANELDWTNQFFSPAYRHIRDFMAQVPYQSCMGNHEGNGILFVKYFPYPFVNTRYWSFDYGPLHVAVVDQYTTYTSGSAQYNWLASDLAASPKPWKFIALHEPGWSAGGGHDKFVSQSQDRWSTGAKTGNRRPGTQL